jgi:hypothetical protein
VLLDEIKTDPPVWPEHDPYPVDRR